MEKIREIWFLYKNKIIIGLALCLLSIISFVGVYYLNIQKTTADSIEFKSFRESTEEPDEEKAFSKSKSNSYTSTIKVDIKGEIKNPGVYEVDLDKRVSDVIKLAGGITSNADTSVTNLSKKVTDEMVIIIYSKKEVQSFTETKKVEDTKEIKCKNNEKLINDSCVSNSIFSNKSTSQNKVSMININTASIDELMNLSGIGESKAKSIVEFRTKNGKFKKIEDILNVTGIGESLFEKIKSNITV